MSLEDIPYDNKQNVDNGIVKTLKIEVRRLEDEISFVSECLYHTLQTIDTQTVYDITEINLSPEKLEKLSEWYKNYSTKLEEHRQDVIRHAKLKLTPEEIEALGL
jgi:hypothetical protein